MNRARQFYRAGELDAAANALGGDYEPRLEQFIASMTQLGSRDAAHSDRPFPGWLAGLFLKRDFTTLAGDECRKYFHDNLPVVRKTLATGKDWFFDLKNGDAPSSLPDLHDLSGHMADTCLMLQAGKPRVYNPLTGRLSETALSILPDLVLLRDTREIVLVSCAPRPFTSNTFEGSYILPERKLILHLQGDNGKGVYKLIRDDLARVASNFHNIAGHALTHTHSQDITLSDRPVSHLGHYLWNCLAAWETLNQSGLAPAARHLASWTEGDYFGNPFELLPELNTGESTTLRIASLEDAVDHIHASNSFWLPMYDRYIRRELANRIIRHSESIADQGFLAQTRQIRESGGPVILLTIRTGNRAWVNQETGYRLLITELIQRYPGAAFVLDGMNARHSDSSTHQFMDTRAELALAQEILSALDADTRVLNTIGMPIAHSIVACSMIDAFVAPWGTAMTKYKWVANKPGIAFGGQAPGHVGIGVRVFDRFRDDLVPAIDIPRKYISDAGAGNLNEPLRRNFDLRWEIVLEYLVSLLGDLGFEPDSG